MCSKGPKMVAIRNYHGTPVPPGKMPLCFQTGEVIELLKGDPDTSWWEVWYYKMNIYHVYIDRLFCGANLILWSNWSVGLF